MTKRRIHTTAWPRSILMLLAMLVPVLSAHAVVAMTRCVNPGGSGGCFATIQAAVDASSAGDVIAVAAGTYIESVTIGTSLTITGAGASTTIIDANRLNRVLTVNAFASVAISGLTMRNGSFTDTFFGGDGGGISNSGTLTVANSVITGNTAVRGASDQMLGGRGGGIFSTGDNARLTVVQTIVSGNTAIEGGGVENFSNSTTTIQDGTMISDNTAASGGGIFNAGTLVAIEVSIIANHATDGANNAFGGGIYTRSGNLTLDHVTIGGTATGSGNQSSYLGGGIFIEGGSAILRNSSQVLGNTAYYGGGIYNGYVTPGHLTIQDGSIVDSNTAYSGAGIFNGGGILTVTGSTITNNATSVIGAFQAFGGGIYNTYGGQATLVGSIVSNNIAIPGYGANLGRGGGIANDAQCVLNLTNTLVSGNTALSDGGGIANQSGGQLTIAASRVVGNGTHSFAGGILNSGVAQLTDSTISDNSAPSGAGGIENNGTLTLARTTVSRNTVTGGASGIYSGPPAHTALTNSTISDNRLASGGGGVGIRNDGGVVQVTSSTIANNGTGLDVGTGTTTLINSIIADGCTAPVTSGDYNLDSGTTCGLSGAHDRVNAAPLLAPLGDNGGPTQTIALQPGSPAIDAIPPTGTNCSATDQRSFPRPYGAGCDIGAFELTVLQPAPAPRPGPASPPPPPPPVPVPRSGAPPTGSPVPVPAGR